MQPALSREGRYPCDVDRGGDSGRIHRGRSILKGGSAAPVRKILLIGLRSLGDVVLTTGSLSALKELFPEARIDYLTRAPFDGLLSEEPGLDSAFSLPIDGGGILGKIISYLRFLIAVRKNRYDLLIDFFARGPRSRVITLLSGADRRVGMVDRSGWIHKKVDRFIYTMTVCPPVQLALTRDRIPYLISRIGRMKGTHLPHLTQSEAGLFSAREILHQEGIPEDRYWVFFCGSGARTKNWPPERFREIADRLLAKGFHVLCLGGTADLAQQEEFKGCFGTLPPEVHIKTQLPWGTLKGLCHLAQGVLSNDSGPAHIAQATGTPTVVLFGPGDHVSYAPFLGRFLKADLGCQPCQSFAGECPDNQCMKMIPSDKVWEEMQRLPKRSQTVSFSEL